MKAAERGRLAAELLRGIWREDVSSSDVEIDDVLRRTLAQTGGLGLAARRLITHVDPVAIDARATQWWQAREAAAQGRAVVDAVATLRSAGIEPVLLKGLAAARHYPIAGARPSGDVDLLVSPGCLLTSIDVLRDLGYHRKGGGTRSSGEPFVTLVGPDAVIDLQTGLWPLDQGEARRALSADASFCLEGVPIRVPPTEVEIRLFAVHAVKHGFLRPIWSCDVAAAIERSPDVPWDVVLAGPWRVRSWIVGAVGVAERLLGMRVPAEVRKHCQGSGAWLEPLVLACWGNGERPGGSGDALVGALVRQHSLSAAIRALLQAWPDGLDELTKREWPLSRALVPTAVLLGAAKSGIGFARHLPQHVASS